MNTDTRQATSYSRCENCGSRVYSLGCVNCNELAYIQQQSEFDELDAAEAAEPPKWWGYRHTSGGVQAKRYFNDSGSRASIQDAHESGFCAQVVGPFVAHSREEALRIVAERTRGAA